MYLFAFSVFSPLETGSAHILPTLSLGREQGYCILQHKSHSLKHFLPFNLWSSEGGGFRLLLLIYLFLKDKDTTAVMINMRSINQVYFSKHVNPVIQFKCHYSTVTLVPKCLHLAYIYLFLAADTFSSEHTCEQENLKSYAKMQNAALKTLPDVKRR